MAKTRDEGSGGSGGGRATKIANQLIIHLRTASSASWPEGLVERIASELNVTPADCKEFANGSPQQAQFHELVREWSSNNGDEADHFNNKDSEPGDFFDGSRESMDRWLKNKDQK